MNKTETKAHAWFISQGIPEEAIVFRIRKSPDFIFTDREVKYEVKRLYGRKVLLRPKQFKILKSQEHVVILVFSDEEDQPIARIPISEIDEKTERYGNVLIYWVYSKQMNSVGVSEYVKNRFDDLKERNGHTSMDSVIRWLLMKAAEEEG